MAKVKNAVKITPDRGSGLAGKKKGDPMKRINSLAINKKKNVGRNDKKKKKNMKISTNDNNKKKKIKLMGKGKTKKRATGSPNSSISSSTPPPKPKRLKKGPFKFENLSQNNDIVEVKNKVKRISSNISKGDEDLVQSADTKERIKQIRNNKTRDNFQSQMKMIVRPGGKWFEESEQESKTSLAGLQGDSELIKDIKVEIRRLAKEEIAGIRKTATQLYDNDCAAYRQACMRGDQKSDFQWMEKMMKVGTLPDKMAAYVVKIQDSPVHNLHHLQNLISMVKVQSKQQCLMAADTLKDLFLEDLLPPDRKLQAFDKRGSALRTATRIQLIKWIYEDRLKTCYKSFVDALKRMSLDNINKIRAKAILIIYLLLSSHPELEADLLQMLVNKLGDLIKKVGSRALFYLNSLLRDHPRMKLVVIDEVERLLFRNNIAKRAQYYGICFLNTINLEDEHPEIACKLINVYIAFFKGCIKTGDIESKMMSALLTGVNKSYPLAKEYGFKFAENIDTLFKITHLSNFNICIQALSILFQLTDVDNRPNEADRYYRVLYQELLRPEIATTSHSLQFLNLIFKSMKCDNKINRVMGFCKRLLQICQNVQPNLACAILFLLSEVSKIHKDIINVGKVEIEQDEVLLSDAEDNDSEEENINQSDIANLVKISNVKIDDGNADEADRNENSKEEEQDPSAKVEVTEEDKNVEIGTISIVDLNTSGIICEDEDVNVKSEVDYKTKPTDYDPIARNPCYCGAEFSLFHEIVTLTSHFHPSVALFAKELLHKRHISYEGNPLKDFTVTRFLERFAYKNAKKPKSASLGHRVYQPKGLRCIPVNSADYLKHEEQQIPVEERFFYRYFKERKSAKEDNDDAQSETESVGDDEFDELMANYFKSAKGKNIDEDDDDDEDLDFAADIHQKPVNKKRKLKNEEDDSDGDEDEESENDEEEDDDFGPADDADDMLDLDDDYDDDDDFHDEDGVEVFEEDDYSLPAKKKMKKRGRGVDMFAPAEKFAEMLESNADEGLSGPSTLINRDNADPKQLHWEMERDRWVKGFKGNSKTRFKNKRKNKQNK